MGKQQKRNNKIKTTKPLIKTETTKKKHKKQTDFLDPHPVDPQINPPEFLFFCFKSMIRNCIFQNVRIKHVSVSVHLIFVSQK